MSLFPAFVGARQRQDRLQEKLREDLQEKLQQELQAELQGGQDPEAADDLFVEPAHADDNDVFNLLPPQEQDAGPPSLPKPVGGNRHPVDMTDLSRLSIDRDGRLYWDGKPVETHHRFAMSRRQVIGAGIVAALVAISAIGAALQGAAAARDWACRLGWSAGVCAMPSTPRALSDIPA